MWAPRSSLADMRRAEAAAETSLPTHPDSLIARLQRTRQAAAAALPALLGRPAPTEHSTEHSSELTTTRTRACPRPARCHAPMRIIPQAHCRTVGCRQRLSHTRRTRASRSRTAMVEREAVRA